MVRKNENRAGRWTSPDPYNGSASVGNPQSWNRYSYVESQPTNFVDPSGLDEEAPIFRMEVHTWASTFASWWWIFFGVSRVRNGGHVGEGGAVVIRSSNSVFRWPKRLGPVRNLISQLRKK
ncbi:MAG: hypothetical protein IPN69_07905 [Acidobacteria bacterium]|nr:hypothetical protein [Acidobacteriota bacterium]